MYNNMHYMLACKTTYNTYTCMYNNMDYMRGCMDQPYIHPYNDPYITVVIPYMHPYNDLYITVVIHTHLLSSMYGSAIC